jgi:hypothetical protein
LELDTYINNPIGQIKQEAALSQICAHPFKKCLFLVTNVLK